VFVFDVGRQIRHRSPQANAFCERVIATIRRECIDWMIPFNEDHLRRVLQQRVTHYNRGRPHMSLGPGIPDAPDRAQAPSEHRVRDGHRVVVKSTSAVSSRASNHELHVC